MNNQQPQNSERAIAQAKLTAARSNLLLMIILTVVNIVLLAFGANVMMLFSATVPYYAAGIGILSEIGILSIVGIGIAAFLLLVYFLCWIFSKKHYGWMIAALVLFILDIFSLVGLSLLLEDFSGILDVIIHIWVLYYLIIGVKYGYRLKHLPEEPETVFSATIPEEVTPVPEVQAPAIPDSTPSEKADENDE